jgi:hypothetical protein
MPKRETAKPIKIGRVFLRSWKEYVASAPRLASDFPKRLPDPRPEKVKPL